MPQIKVLSQNVANLIAAGEVVERPLSVIKELIENSIDAGADDITVEIKRGGIAFIRVTDNGCGMSKENLSVCLLRHATSKISDERDLSAIMTLGFRGEALAATAAVSKYRIMTREKGSETGHLLIGEYGGKNDITETGAPEGTTIIIEELFSNVPARRKFLKKDSTEAAAALSTVEKMALSKPHIAFRFISDGVLKFETPGDGELKNAIYAVLGRSFASKLKEVDGLFESVRVSGFIGTPENIKINRTGEIFFINGRYARCATASAAIEQAFRSYIPEDKFPVCVLNIELHPAFVDVNVHPTKMEVKFSDSHSVFDAVYCSVQNVLRSRLERATITDPDNMEERARQIAHSFVPINDRVNDEVKQPDNSGYTMFSGEDNKKSHFLDREESRIINEQADTRQAPEKEYGTVAFESPVRAEISESAPEAPKEKERDIPYFRVIGEAFHAFIIVELDGAVLAIDKHAAHERMLFEKMRENAAQSKPQSQLLLIPLEIPLGAEERDALFDYEEEVRSIGFEFERTENGVTVTGIPGDLGSSAAEAMISRIASALSEGKSSVEIERREIYEKALFTAACKAATKAGWVDSDEEIKKICEAVICDSRIRFCPHGRPVAFEISRSEIERRFERS